LKNSEDHEVKKDHGQVQANWANQRERDCFKCGEKGHLAKDCVVKNVKCRECGGEHATEKHDAVMKVENRGEEYRAFQEYRAKLKDKDKDKDKKQKPRRDQKKAGDKKAYSAEQADSDSGVSEDEVDEDDGKIDAYHMRIVRNSGYGYPSMGGVMMLV
jgi:hypothetical protein